MKNQTERECVVYELIRTARMHRAVLDSRFADMEQGRSTHAVLREISKAECLKTGPLSQKQLAKAVGVTPAAMAMTLKKMEEDGLIVRKTAENDNRRNELFLSDKGKALVKQTHDTFRALDTQTYAGLTSEEIDCMLGALHKMQENLRALMPNADLPTQNNEKG